MNENLIDFEQGDAAILIKGDGQLVIYNSCDENDPKDVSHDSFRLAIALAETVNNDELLEAIFFNMEEVLESEESEEYEELDDYVEFIPDFNINDVFFSKKPDKDELN